MYQQSLFESERNIATIQRDFLSAKPLAVRKSLGQFFTGTVVADYMASLISKPESKVVRLLDAGAGAGILTASAAIRCLDLGCQSVHAVLYELDQTVIPNLEETLEIIQETFQERRATFTYEIYCEDFVLARSDKALQAFDIAVINPPYFKYSAKGSPYAKAAGDLYRGDPNIYASFLAIVMASMGAGGQMVTITPRSFTNGLYFKGFRSYLLTESSLELIHVFKHRDKVFKNEESEVLQENVICRFVKGKSQQAVTVRSSDCDASMSDTDEESYPVSLIIDPSNDQKIIRVPETADEADILKQAERLPSTFEASGYFISTGRVVEHRAREFITQSTGQASSIPLYRPHNITPLDCQWTGSHKKDVAFFLTVGHEKHTLKNCTFVLLKRFSSKDEKRRLVAGVHTARMHDCELIGFGNKTNYIGYSDGTLSVDEAYGIAAIFNSSFMDKYFRCISGNTQVNATEIRVMKFPKREQVEAIGIEARQLDTFSTADIDSIVHLILEVTIKT